MSTTAAILRAAAEMEKTPAMPDQLSSWVQFDSDEWHAVVGCLDNPCPTNIGLLGGLKDAERRALLILVAEVIGNPQYPQEDA